MRFSVWRGPVREKLLLAEHITKTLFDIYKSFVGPQGNLLGVFLFVFLHTALLSGKAVIKRHRVLQACHHITHLLPLVLARILLHRIGEPIISIMLLVHWLDTGQLDQRKKVPFRFIVNAGNAGSKLIRVIIGLIIFNFCLSASGAIWKGRVSFAGQPSGEAINLQRRCAAPSRLLTVSARRLMMNRLISAHKHWSRPAVKQVAVRQV